MSEHPGERDLMWPPSAVMPSLLRLDMPNAAEQAVSTPGTSRHQLGANLRRLRQAHLLRLEDVAAKLGIAASTLSRIETGRSPVRGSYLIMMLDIYGVHDQGERACMVDLARAGLRKSWWADRSYALPKGLDIYLDLEAAACRLEVYAVWAVPGLAQIPGYAASAVRLSCPAITENEARDLAAIQTRRVVQLRADRQLHLIIDEAALLRLVAAPHVMAAQLEHLLTVAAAPTTTVQVMALTQSAIGNRPSFTVLSFLDSSTASCFQAPSGQIVLSRCAAEAQAALDTFRGLAEAALSPEQSADLIRRLAQRELRTPTCPVQSRSLTASGIGVVNLSDGERHRSSS